jgi:L-alanine-DL-glutamate epimerase-like enolase superfamily enzyme
MQLRIIDVELLTINVPLSERTRPWLELLVGQWSVVEICKVTTNVPGLVGFGETIPHYTWRKVTDAAIKRVIGGNPAEFMQDDHFGAGLQMALYDLVGKALEVPMHRLLSANTIRNRTPISWWSTKMPPEILALEAKDAVAAGYMSHKFKARPWFDVREQVKALAAVTPVDYKLDIDWNEMLLSPAEALPVLQELDKEPRIGIYEDPIMRLDAAGQKFLRSRVDHPIATHFNPILFPTWMKEDSLDAFVVDAGGVSRFMRDGLSLAGFEKNFWLQICGTGITTAYTTHIGSVLTHARYPAVTAMNIYADDMLAEPVKIEAGFAHLPEGYGLGLAIDEDAIERYRMQPPYSIDLLRKILTFRFASGYSRTFAGTDHMWRDFRDTNGTLPTQSPGANLEVWEDDGSSAFDEQYRRAERTPGGFGDSIL